MKMWSDLQKLLDQAGLPFCDARLEALRVYLGELQRWNKSYSLTTIIEPEEIIRKHFLDSLNYGFGLGPAARILDIGSGPGFPGLPLAIFHPQREFILLEARRKKTLFLDFMRRRLGLENLHIIHLHLQTRNAREVFGQRLDGVVTRAVKVDDGLLDLLATGLESGGRLVLSLTENEGRELRHRLARDSRWHLEKKVVVPLPGRAEGLGLQVIIRR